MYCNRIYNVSSPYPAEIMLGVWGEENVRTVTFDISPWVAAHGPGVLQIIANRPGETLETGEPLVYAVSDVSVDGGTATWTVTDVDTAIPGVGSCALVYMVGDDVVAKTPPYKTRIKDTLGHSGTTVPPALEAWYNDILQASADAQQAADDAEAAAAEATASAIHQPIIGPNGNWWTWDVGTGAYVDTGYAATTGSYNRLLDHPSINGNELIGDKSGAELGLVDAEDGKGLSTNDYTDAAAAQLAANTAAISSINGKIPSTASPSNQLSDKAYVDNAINSSTAFFRGSFATHAALMAVPWQDSDPTAANYVTNNDYAYIEDDETHDGEAWRYIYADGWQPQFRVNESPLTPEQVAALNSGATAASIAQIGANTTAITAHVADKSNPHQVTKAQVGLGDVDNTSDASKPVSGPQAQYIAGEIASVNQALANYLPLAGGQMVGDIKLNGGAAQITPSGGSSNGYIRLTSSQMRLQSGSTTPAYIILSAAGIITLSGPMVRAQDPGETTYSFVITDNWITANILGKLMPAGGTPGQFLVKSSSADYDAGWVTVPQAQGVSF